MSEFKIKVSVELDSSDLESKLNALGKDQKIPVTLDMNKIDSQLKSLKNSLKNTFKLDNGVLGDINKVAKALDKLGSSTKTIGKGNSGTSSLVKEYKELANTVSKLQKQLDKGGLGENSVNRTKAQMTDMLTQMQKIKSQMSDIEKMDIALFNEKMDNKALVDMNNYISKIEASATSLSTKLGSLSLDNIDSGKIEKLQNELKEIQTTADNIDINFEMEGINNIFSDLNRIKSEIKDLEKINSNLDKVNDLASSFDKIKSSANSAGVEVKDFSETIENLQSNAKELDGSFDKAFKNAKNELKDMQSEVKKASSENNKKSSKDGGLFGNIFGTKDDFLGNFSQFKLLDLAGDFIASGIQNVASAWKDTVIETDKAMTDLRKVYDNNLTGDNLKGYLNNVTEVAKGTGKSSVDVIQGTAKAVQSGIKDIDDALVFARQSAMFSNVGDVSQEQADTMLTSIMSAYGGVENSLKPVREQVQGMGKDYNTLTKFMDLANHAGNRYAVSTSDIGTALQASSAALKTNGVTLEESVAMAVAMNEVLQDSSKSGNALKSISANMAGVTVSAKDGTIQMNKSAKALKEIAGIEVWDKQTGQVKDMYEVMDELSGKWNSLSEVQQNALGTTIAGKL